jgi:DnaK suppressor protein
MSHTVERVAVEHGGAVHEALIRYHTAAHEAWVRQDALVATMRDNTDRGPGDEADNAATHGQLDEQVTLAYALRAQLDGLAAAVTRCESGAYGRCERCHESIPAERLELFPAATHCVSCKQQFEHR